MKATAYVFILLGLVLHTCVQAEVGEVKYARGAVTVQQQDGSGARLVGKGDSLDQGEVIKTGSRSFAIIKLADETKMTLRPDTSFTVEQMDASNDSKASALLHLFRGGFRAITGYISKRNPRGYRVKTSVATIGIRGTEFDARLCARDCNEENQKIRKKLDKKVNRVVGRVVFKQGDIKALNFAEKTRVLKTRSDLYEGDTLITGDNSHAVLVFRDKSRISLQENSNFRIDELRFKDEKSADSSALFSLLRGGLRTVTGLIGKLKPTSYRMRTRVSTIGIRGTGYDLLCNGECADENLSRHKTVDMPEAEGLYASVWQGSIIMGDTVLDEYQAAYVRDKNTAAVLLPVVPKFFRDNSTPRPDSFELKKGDDDFAQKAPEFVPPGLYVSVTEGEVTVKGLNNQSIAILPGQAGYTDMDGRQVKHLPAIPVFQQFDNYPTPRNLTPKVLDVGIGNIDSDEDLLCEIQ